MRLTLTRERDEVDEIGRARDLGEITDDRRARARARERERERERDVNARAGGSGVDASGRERRSEKDGR